MTAVAAAAVAPASPSAGLVNALEVEPVGGAGPALGDGQKNVWSYLEEMANTLLSNVQQLKTLIEQAKGAQAEAAGVKGHGCRKEVRKQSDPGKELNNDSNFNGKYVCVFSVEDSVSHFRVRLRFRQRTTQRPRRTRT